MQAGHIEWLSFQGLGLVGGVSDGSVRIWDPMSGQLQATLGQGRSAEALAFHGLNVAIARQNTVEIWNGLTGRLQGEVEMKERAYDLYLRRNSLRVGLHDGRVAVIEPSEELGYMFTGVAPSPGAEVASGSTCTPR